MPKINTVSPKGPQFLVHCDDYSVQFDAVEVTVSGVAGDILEDAGTKVSDTTSGAVLGILAEDTDGTGWVRVMTRGNPSTVDRQQLNYGAATEATIDALLADLNIIVVNSQ